MAIDSAEKRRAAANLYRLGGPGVTPNAGQDAEWRQQVGYGYSGVASDLPPDPTPEPDLSPVAQFAVSLGIYG